MELKRFLEFLHEAEKLKSVTRHSWTSTGRHESVPEHSWRMALMAIILEKEFPEVDMQRVIEMAIVHDLGEVYAGDTPAFEEKDDNEEKDLKRLLKPLDRDVQEKITKLWQEYHEAETKEALLAKALDKLEVLIQHNEADIKTWLPEEYDLNYTHGKKYTDFHKVTKELRKLVDEETTMNIDGKK